MDRRHEKALSSLSGTAFAFERLGAGNALDHPAQASGQRLAARLYLIRPAQFSSFLVWPDDLADWHLYAKHRASLAGARADSQRLAARPGGRAASAAGAALLDLRRGLCRSLAQTARLARDPSGGYDPGAAPLGADSDRHRTSL